MVAGIPKDLMGEGQAISQQLRSTLIPEAGSSNIQGHLRPDMTDLVHSVPLATEKPESLRQVSSKSEFLKVGPVLAKFHPAINPLYPFWTCDRGLKNLDSPNQDG